MSTTMSPGPNGSPSVTQLVSGIVGDVQDLGMQHLALFRNEIKEDLRKATNAALSLAIGLAVTQIGGLLIGLMFVHLLSQLVPNLSIWICYGIVGVVIAGVGAISVTVGIKKMKSVDTLSHEAVQAMKDDQQWLTNSK